MNEKDCKLNGHEYVDLGLSVLWATCNVGANKSFEYGDYFSWGETMPKTIYSIETYKWWDKGKDQFSFTKYKGRQDNETVLDEEDDAATTNWGRPWRMPTKEEMKELSEGCDWEWQTDYKGTGITGFVGTSRLNGKKIFLPAAGYNLDGNSFHDGFNDVGTRGRYWSSSHGGCPEFAYYLILFGNVGLDDYCRFFGQSVRAVVDKESVALKEWYKRDTASI